MLVLISEYCSLLVSGVFFQAEDGIRDLVRSRGLGDVYKRQRQTFVCLYKIFSLVNLAYIEWRISHYKIAFLKKVVRVAVKTVALNYFSFNAMNGKVHFRQLGIVGFLFCAVTLDSFIHFFVAVAANKISCLHKHATTAASRVMNDSVAVSYTHLTLPTSDLG